MDYRSECLQHNECFGRVWRECAAAGLCDEYGGAEYTRCLFEWIDARRPRPITHFIRIAANRPAPTTTPTV